VGSTSQRSLKKEGFPKEAYLGAISQKVLRENPEIGKIPNGPDKRQPYVIDSKKRELGEAVDARAPKRGGEPGRS